MLVKLMLVPLVEACVVPLVITLPPIVGVLIVGLLSVGVAIVGLVPNTFAPVPVAVVTPVPPEATGRAVPRPEIVPPVIATALAF